MEEDTRPSMGAYVAALDLLLRSLYADKAIGEPRPTDYIDGKIGDMRESIQRRLNDPDYDDAFLKEVEESLEQFGENVKLRLSSHEDL